MDFLAIVLFWIGTFFALAIVHESGHYFAGWAAGIPPQDMRIRLFCFPQHVVLRSGERWVSPVSNIDEYVTTVWRYLATTPRVYLYVAGGFLQETVFTAIVCIVLILTGWPKVALAIVGFSLLANLGWLIVDTVMTLRGRIFGDFSGLWGLAPVPTAFFIAAFFAVRGVILWYTIA